MLKSLTIHQIALIDDVRIQLHKGMQAQFDPGKV